MQEIKICRYRCTIDTYTFEVFLCSEITILLDSKCFLCVEII